MKSFNRSMMIGLFLGMAALPGATFAEGRVPEASMGPAAEERDNDFAIMSRPIEARLWRIMTSPVGASEADVAFFRGFGRQGLDVIVKAQARHPENQNLRKAADLVAGQRNASDARLFWHTDMKSALAAAQKENKPIVYLRLLGKLTDEYSCANSRYFRTVLYADPKVSASLRERYVLVWESERPVPVVTVDFGDGRTIKQTITGNSVHYVLTKEGVVMDAMPGLYSPEAFLDVLDGTGVYVRIGAAAYHTQVRNSLLREGGGQAQNAQGVQVKEMDAAQEAARAMVNTRSKAGGEIRTLRALSPEHAQRLAEAISKAGWEDWEKIGAARPVRLSKESVAVIARQLGQGEGGAGNLEAVVKRFEKNIGLETARNQYVMRRQIHEWLLEKEPMRDLETLNTRVYADIFRTPRTDPWLGLVDPEAYTGVAIRSEK